MTYALTIIVAVPAMAVAMPAILRASRLDARTDGRDGTPERDAQDRFDDWCHHDRIAG